MRISDWSSDVCSADLVANAYVNLREAQFRAKAYRTECELQHQILSLTYQRYQQGVLPLFPLGNANAELELLKSQLAEAEADTAVLLDALAILAGQIPGTTDEALKQIFDVPLPPEQVAVGDPSNLVARRPDIRAAERSLAAATARIGVAERSEEHTSELQSLMRITYAVFCLKKTKHKT